MKIVVNMDKKFFIFLVLTIFLTSFIGISGAVPPGPPYNPGHFANQVDFSTPIDQVVTFSQGVTFNQGATFDQQTTFNNVVVFNQGASLLGTLSANSISTDNLNAKAITVNRGTFPNQKIYNAMLVGDIDFTSNDCQTFCIGSCLFGLDSSNNFLTCTDTKPTVQKCICY